MCIVMCWPRLCPADPDTASLLAAKEQRITELRAALSSLLADKGALRRELVAAREEQAAVATAAQAASSAAAAAGEQQERKLQDSQVGITHPAAHAFVLNSLCFHSAHLTVTQHALDHKLTRSACCPSRMNSAVRQWRQGQSWRRLRSASVLR